MRNEYHNIADERKIKQLKESIDLLRLENKKLREDNKTIVELKETIKQLKKEKLEMSQKIIDYESEAFLYKSPSEEKEDILLYNPNLSNKKLKKNLSKTKFFFCLKGINRANNLFWKSDNTNKNEEINALKNELIRKDNIISLLKSSKKIYKPVIINNFSINSSSNTSQLNSKNNSGGKYMTFKMIKKIL